MEICDKTVFTVRGHCHKEIAGRKKQMTWPDGNGPKVNMFIQGDIITNDFHLFYLLINFPKLYIFIIFLLKSYIDTKNIGNKRKNKMDFIKITNFCVSKDAINEVKKKTDRMGENSCKSYI